MSILDKSFVTAEAKAEAKAFAEHEEVTEVDIDLLPVRFKLVHANTNLNKDHFTSSELEASASTPVHKPIDWQHTDRIIGVMTASEFVTIEEGSSSEAENVVEDNHIVVDGVVYQFLFPAYAQEMIERNENDELCYSMEVWFEEAECSSCGSSFAKASEYCNCLNNRFASGSTTSRILKGLTFGGVGVVENPADVEAISISVGEDTPAQSTAKEENSTKEELMSKEAQVTFDSQEAFEAAVKTRVDEALQAVEAGQVAEQLQTELDEATAKIVELEKQLEEAVAAHQEEVTKLTDEAEAAKAELSTFKAEIAAEAQLEERLTSLEEAGVKLPEDKELADKIVASIRTMDDAQFEGYKATVFASIEASTNKEAHEDGEELPSGTEGAHAQIDVPNPTKTSATSKFPATETILAKQSA